MLEEIIAGLKSLSSSTGVANMILPPNPELEGIAQFLYQFGSPIMIIVCLFLLWLGIKKQFEPLLLVPIAFGGLLANIPVAGIAQEGGFLYIIYHVGIQSGLFPLFIFSFKVLRTKV